jgi:hypothetical protein
MRLFGTILAAAGAAGLLTGLCTAMSTSLAVERDLFVAGLYKPVKPLRVSELEAVDARLALADEQKHSQFLEDALVARQEADRSFLRLFLLSLLGLAAGSALRWAAARRARARAEGPASVSAG